LSRCLALLDKHIETKAVDLTEPILLHFYSIAWLFTKLEKREEAISLFEKAYRGISALHGLQHNITKWLTIKYPAKCIQQDRLVDAKAVLEPILRDNQAVEIKEDIQLVNITMTLASSYGKHGRVKEAEEMFR
jgi:tetratricopeptide (TPR) repeat protein